jgi:hypothetical protein
LIGAAVLAGVPGIMVDAPLADDAEQQDQARASVQDVDLSNHMENSFGSATAHLK